MANATCFIDDCGEFVVGRGLCNKHYKRMRRHGDPRVLPPRKLPPQNLPRTIGCTVDGCEEKHFAKGMCKNHHANARYHANREREQAKQAAYRAKPENRSLARARTKVWRDENPERALDATRQWYASNKDRVLEYRRSYREANRERVRLHNIKRKLRHKAIEIMDLTAEEWMAIKEEWNFRCAYCGCTPELLTIDHVAPISKGGNHTASNIVPACQSCNSRKGDRDAPPFYYELTA